MKFIKTVVIAAAMLVSANAMAVEVEGDVGLYSDYIWRGVSQTGGGSAAQANLSVDFGNGLYVGGFTSNVDLPDSRYELDLFAGIANQVNWFTYDVGAIAYIYPGEVSDVDIDTYEVYGAAGYANDLLSVGAQLNYSPDYFGSGNKSYYTSIPLDVSLGRTFDVGASVGYLNINDPVLVNHTTDWKVYGTAHAGPVDFTVAYTYLNASTTDFEVNIFEDFEFDKGNWVGSVAYTF